MPSINVILKSMRTIAVANAEMNRKGMSFLRMFLLVLMM